MADIIQLLPPLIANQIAAGEVIERPSSIIKELIENSLDAGSTEIVVSIRKSGNNLISVRDNGSGISKNDLPLAICQHATSKLKELADLDNITSLGFRGEALASICAVARVQITSRQVDNDKAYSLIVDHENPENYKIVEDAHPVGTTITVQDLFYSTPVRRRFLKADKTELIHIIDIFQKLALSNFNCSFTLIDEGKLVYKLINTHANGNHQRVQKIFGKNFIENAVHFTSQGQGIKLEGWVGNCNYHRSQTDQQYFFLNNRIIRDKLILHAVKYVYETLIPAGRHPCYILYLTIDPDQFDINVHPTKHEVRFYDSRWIHQFITQQLSKVLLEHKDTSGIIDISDNNFGSQFETKSKIEPKVITNCDVYRSARLNIPAILQKVQSSKNFANSANFFVEHNTQPAKTTSPRLLLGEIIANINNSLVITFDKTANIYYLVDLARSYQYFAWQELQSQWQANKKLISHHLNIVSSYRTGDLSAEFIANLEQLGVVLQDNKIIAVPAVLQFAEPQLIFEVMYDYFSASSSLGSLGSYESLFKKLANLALGRLEGNLLISEQVNILDKLANIQYDGPEFNGRHLYKKLLPADLEIFLTV